MATFNLESSINALPDTPVLPCYEEHPVVQSKILDFAAFKHLGPREVYEALSSFITSMDMLVIAHSDTAQPVPISPNAPDDLRSSYSGYEDQTEI